MGPGVANECIESKDGPHIWEDHFLPEIIDSETGRRLEDGAEGELVFTSLTKRAFPILRYRTRDLSTLLPGTARPAMRRMAKITGRNDDMIILRGVNLFPTQIEEIVLGRRSALDPLRARAHAARADGRADNPNRATRGCKPIGCRGWRCATHPDDQDPDRVDGCRSGCRPGDAPAQRGQAQAAVRPAPVIRMSPSCLCQTGH